MKFAQENNGFWRAIGNNGVIIPHSKRRKKMILIVIEDTPAHQQDAKLALTEAGFELRQFDLLTSWKLVIAGSIGNIFLVVQDYQSFYELFRHIFYDEKFKKRPLIEIKVISDYNFPLGPEHPVQPVGLLVGAECAKHNIPFVFCTDAAQHGREIALLENFRCVSEWKRRIIARTIDGHKRWQDAIKEVTQDLF